MGSIPNQPIALVTGAAQRIGAEIARALHQAGMDIALHYRHSKQEAQSLQSELQQKRANSARLMQADLNQPSQCQSLVDQVNAWRGRLDLLVNNASLFYPTPIESLNSNQWDELMGANLKAPFFLATELAPLLRAQHGAIVNLVDIHAERPLRQHPIYSIAKAGNAMMVKSLALELAPEIRVNGVAPGAILWPEQQMSPDHQRATLDRTPLGRTGTPQEIAKTVRFLAMEGGYITGQIITVDGGRSVQQ